MSYAGLVLDLDGAERGEQLLDEVVLLVVEGGAAEVGEAERAPDAFVVLVVPLPALTARLDDAVGDHVHRPIEGQLLPVAAVRTAVLHLVLARRTGGELQRGRALRTQPAAADRRVGVTFDLDDLAALHEHVL